MDGSEKVGDNADFYGGELLNFLEENESKIIEYLDNIAQESKVVRSRILRFICHKKPEWGQRIIQNLIEKHQEKLEVIYIRDGVEEIFLKDPKLFFDLIKEYMYSPTQWKQKLVTELLELISDAVLKFDKETIEKARKETLFGFNKFFNLLGLRD
ncbi:MAG: hypothetical protein ACUVXA_03125 [Candidatus Jordarchaeum sp.]|uniref:hypothetical protein n=1 Tax=Candidatus Jordarchaeum sp. TaxID=2823881 RepID=UPI00404B3D57